MAKKISKATKSATKKPRTGAAAVTAKKGRTGKPGSAKRVETSIETRFLQDQMEKTAYGLFEQRGHTHGYDVADWLEAEKIVLKRWRKSSKPV